MKSIVGLYSIAMFCCIILGCIVALGVHYSPWYLLLLIIPVSFGWLPMAEIMERAKKHQNETIIFTVSLFSVFTIAAVLSGVYNVDVHTYWGKVYSISLFASWMVSLFLMLRAYIMWRYR